jgi:hypothetical protein
MKSSKTNVRGASRKAMEKKEPTQFGDHLDFKQMKFLRKKINKLKK